MLAGENIGKIALHVHLDGKTLGNRVGVALHINALTMFLAGKTLVTRWTVTKFANVFSRQDFALSLFLWIICHPKKLNTQKLP